MADPVPRPRLRARRPGRARWAVVALAAASLAGGLALAAGSPASTPPAAVLPAAAPPVVSAMNIWAMRALAPAEQSRQLRLMRGAGVTTVRDDLAWAEIEPERPHGTVHTFHFAATDALVAALAGAHLRLMPILDYSTPWAARRPGDWRSPPADPDAFAAYARAVAERYGRGGTFWAAHRRLPAEPVETYEVWNEENSAYFWDTGPDPAAYGRLYEATRAAIRAVEPRAAVDLGGLVGAPDPDRSGVVGALENLVDPTTPAPSAVDFVTRMVAAVPSLRGRLDGVGLHPYAADPGGVVRDVVAMRRTVSAVGLGAVPIDVTELGWTYAGGGDVARAERMRETAAALGRSNCGIRVLAAFDWINPAATVGATGGDFGLADGSGVRPAGTAWFHALATAARAPGLAYC